MIAQALGVPPLTERSALEAIWEYAQTGVEAYDIADAHIHYLRPTLTFDQAEAIGLDGTGRFDDGDVDMSRAESAQARGWEST